MPRPVPDPADFRTRFLSARFTVAEAARYEAAAAAAGITVSDMIRAALDGAPPPRRSTQPTADKAMLARLLGAAGHIGGNLNQLAYVANTGGWPDSRAIAAMQADIMEMRQHLLIALGVTRPPPLPGGTMPDPAP